MGEKGRHGHYEGSGGRRHKPIRMENTPESSTENLPQEKVDEMVAYLRGRLKTPKRASNKFFNKLADDLHREQEQKNKNAEGNTGEQSE